MAPYITNRLGEILVEKGFITPEQLYAAIQQQKKHRQRQAGANSVVRRQQPLAVPTAACADEIQRAYHENQHCASLHNFAVTPREINHVSANDPDYFPD